MGNKYDIWKKEVGLDDVTEKEYEPYPCFGKVIKGFDVVKEIAKGMTRASLPKDDAKSEEGYQLDDNLLLRPVRIASMSILENYDPDAKAGDKGKKGEQRMMNFSNYCVVGGDSNNFNHSYCVFL